MTENQPIKSADPAASSIPSRPESQGDLLSPPSPAKQSWRDRIKVHPAAELFPMMSDAELGELGKNILEHGLKQYLTLWTPETVGQFLDNGRRNRFLLDGRNRLEAIERGIADPKEREKAIRLALSIGGVNDRIPGKDRGGAKQLFGDVDPYEYVISANLHRRHLTRKQKRELIQHLLKANPERSDRETARIAKVDHETVGAIRTGLELTGGIRQFEKTVGADGKARPARRSSPPRASKPKSPAAQLRDIAISGFSKLLHQRPADTLDDLARLLHDEKTRITEIPLQKRVELARSYLQTLDISLADLSSGDGQTL
jgi:hypothetical protein